MTILDVVEVAYRLPSLIGLVLAVIIVVEAAFLALFTSRTVPTELWHLTPLTTPHRDSLDEA